jgi:hypothetical protein
VNFPGDGEAWGIWNQGDGGRKKVVNEKWGDGEKRFGRGMPRLRRLATAAQDAILPHIYRVEAKV